MKFTYLILIAFMFSNFADAQVEDIIGKTQKEKLLKTEHKVWFTESYDTYKPDSKSIEKLNYLFKNHDFKIDVYFGTWCSDSQREVPRLIKLLEQSGFNFKNLHLIGVDRDKEVPDVTEEEQKMLNITNVPTIIVYEEGQEINRFVEFAQESLEKDLIKIFSKQPYKHSYQY